MPNDDLLTTTQAVEILGQSRWSLYRLMKAGELTPVMKTPAATGTYLFNRADVEALRDRAEPKPIDAEPASPEGSRKAS